MRRARPLLGRTLKREMQHFHFFFDHPSDVFPAVWDSAESDFDGELEALRRGVSAYTDAVLRRLSGERLVDDRRLDAMRKPSWYRAAAKRYARQHPRGAAMLDEFTASPARSLDRFCAMLRSFYDEVMEPLLGPIDVRLRRDLEMRRDVMRTHGLSAVLRTLSPQLTAVRESATLCAIRLGDTDVTRSLTSGSALTLTPSYFTGPDVRAFLLKRPGGLDCAIVYPLPPPRSARTTADRMRTLGMLVALGERSRLRIVELLALRELSTRELAGFLRMSEPVVSRHLRVLHEAGVVERRRQSYFVLYGLRREALAELHDALDAVAGASALRSGRNETP